MGSCARARGYGAVWPKAARDPTDPDLATARKQGPTSVDIADFGMGQKMLVGLCRNRILSKVGWTSAQTPESGQAWPP